MGTGTVDANKAVLNMLQRQEVLMMEDLFLGRPDFRGAQLFLAIDRLSRKNLVTLSRMGLSYQIRTRNHAEKFGQTPHAAPGCSLMMGLQSELEHGSSHISVLGTSR